MSRGLLEEAHGDYITLGWQDEIDRLAVLVDCPMQILSGTIEPDVFLI